MSTTVSFSKETFSKDHLRRADYTQDELKNSFFSRKELRVIERDLNKDIMWLMGGKHGGEGRFCSLGIERKTPIASRCQKTHRDDAIAAVLQAQQTIHNNNADPELIAKAYANFSNHSSEEAKFMATIE